MDARASADDAQAEARRARAGAARADGRTETDDDAGHASAGDAGRSTQPSAEQVAAAAAMAAALSAAWAAARPQGALAGGAGLPGVAIAGLLPAPAAGPAGMAVPGEAAWAPSGIAGGAVQRPFGFEAVAAGPAGDGPVAGMPAAAAAQAPGMPGAGAADPSLSQVDATTAAMLRDAVQALAARGPGGQGGQQIRQAGDDAGMADAQLPASAVFDARWQPWAPGGSLPVAGATGPFPAPTAGPASAALVDPSRTEAVFAAAPPGRLQLDLQLPQGGQLALDLQFDGQGHARLVVHAPSEATRQALGERSDALVQSMESMGLSVQVDVRQGGSQRFAPPQPQPHDWLAPRPPTGADAEVPPAGAAVAGWRAAAPSDGRRLHWYA